MRFFGYLWAFPNTLLAIPIVPLVFFTGGQAHIVDGVLEVRGGFLVWLRPNIVTTIGHIVLGPDQAAMDWTRRHERVHVSQYERWGLFFLPAYACSSAWELLHGRDPYLDNWFECEARRFAESV